MVEKPEDLLDKGRRTVNLIIWSQRGHCRLNKTDEQKMQTLSDGRRDLAAHLMPMRGTARLRLECIDEPYPDTAATRRQPYQT